MNKPVAWMYKYGSGQDDWDVGLTKESDQDIPLYTHPVKEQELLAEIEALKKQVVIWEKSSKDRAIKLNICAIKVSQLEKELAKYPQQGSSIFCKYTEGI